MKGLVIFNIYHAQKLIKFMHIKVLFNLYLLVLYENYPCLADFINTQITQEYFI